MGPSHAKQLLVEGTDDLHCVIGLLQHHVEWPDGQENAPVFITAAGSVQKILSKSYLSTKLKESGLEVLGVMVDADTHPTGRWAAFRNILKEAGVPLPLRIPKHGFISNLDSGCKLGIWIMPNNAAKGMIETFLRDLVPEENPALWQFAVDSFKHSLTIGGTCKDVHIDKACIHTWLAWQDPPGERLGIALTKKLLDPKAASATIFVEWFKKLFDLKAIAEDS